MIKTVKFFIGFFLCLLLIPFQNSLQTSHTDTFEINGRTLTHDPVVCAAEPYEPDIKDAWEDLSKYTRNAVLDWQTKLKLKGDRGAWNIELKLVSLENRSEVRWSNCNIVIDFMPSPLSDEEKFEVLGVTASDEFDKVTIIIYYLDLDVKRTDSSLPSQIPGYYEQVIEWTYTYANRLMHEAPLTMVIKHELGHALGLGHYTTQDEKRLQKWRDGIERPPSLMIELKPIKVIDTSITNLDIEKIISIYGREGFSLEPEEIVEQKIPDWIRNNAEWWANGLISDSDFAMGIQFMIKNEIIVIPNLEKSPSTFAEKIPEWVKRNVGWWSQGYIPDEDFVNGLQYLVRHGIIRV